MLQDDPMLAAVQSNMNQKKIEKLITNLSNQIASLEAKVEVLSAKLDTPKKTTRAKVKETE